MKITLCGSARFEAEYHRWNELLTMEGHICYSLAVFPSQKEQREWYIEQQKEMLDLVHLAKIEESDATIVINCEQHKWDKEPYVGDSTKREIKWSVLRGKPVFYTNSCRGDADVLMNQLKAYAWKGILGHENI